ncbi:MAG TPA: hypothetical protein VKY45_09520 [Marinilabiliaceae bacterium]|nr:hypothetical protein [Marinilabiliaceae bacterium]
MDGNPWWSAIRNTNPEVGSTFYWGFSIIILDNYSQDFIQI